MREINKTFRKLLHKLSAFLERISPMKGEIVELRIEKNNGEASYTYKRIKAADTIEK